MISEEEKRDLYISSTDCQYQHPPEAWGPGIRDQYIIHYVNSGRGFYHCGGKTWPVHAGQCFFIAPGTLIHYGPDPEEPWTYGWVNFSGTQAEKLLRQTSFGCDCPVVDADPEIREWIKEAAREFSSGTAHGICRSTARLLDILAYLVEMYPEENQKQKENRTTDRAVEYIKNNYRRHNLNAEALARAMHTSTSSLYRSFMQELQISPKEYITQVRIARAETLLIETAFSIKSIAYSVGYTDQMYFSKIFRSRERCSPKEYRARNCSPASPDAADSPSPC